MPGETIVPLIEVPVEYLPEVNSFVHIGITENNFFGLDLIENELSYDFEFNGADTSFTSITIKPQTVSWSVYDYEEESPISEF